MSPQPSTSTTTKSSRKTGSDKKTLKPAQRAKTKVSWLHWQWQLISLVALVAGLLVYYYQSSAESTQPQPYASTQFQSPEERDASIFTVQDLRGKGKGMIAIRDIKQGELIIRERPLFVVPPQISVSPTTLIAQNLQRLSPAGYESFFNLSYVHLPENVDPDVDINEVALAIFQTNAVSAGNDVGIFPRMARLNHGCSSAFNSVYMWREKEGVLAVHALKDIKKGEELLTTYTNMKRPRNQRRQYLQQQYGFYCTCSVCSLPDAESNASDHRLSSMSDLYTKFSSWNSRSIDGLEAIDVVQAIWDLGNQEGYWSERGQLAADAAFVAAAHEDAVATKEWSRLAAEWFGIELGSDSEQVMQMKGFVAQPMGHPAWGTRQVAEVGGPKRLFQ
ncbi:hypothetical protein D9758_007114 [Tetrapyrgos nigripes]|uniref:SET domain-containing protein n=1 Tax=Tetrapyrgos nigripes TaxID=182062 RepID=A0A8H5LMB8_9AGAR|nr:hypothetical protein D9758_007114 [Tetrapyrgos nigripes]